MTDPKRDPLSRRQALGRLLRTGLCLPFAGMLAALRAQSPTPALVSRAGGPIVPSPAASNATGSPLPSGLSPEDDQLLNDIEHASFLFFWEQGSPTTGMVKDRCNVHNTNQAAAASIAATGFRLTALCIGVQRGFIPASDAIERG